MSRRPDVPASSRPLLIRPRLLTVIQQRWQMKVLAISAGPGFGKTTLLAQAFAENALDPRGIDVWFACRRDHIDASSLARAMVRAVADIDTVANGAPGPGWREPVDSPDVGIDTVVDALVARAPVHVTILIDDVHHVTPGSTGAALLGALVDALPVNSHLVMAGRPQLPIALSRLVVQGSAVTLTEAEMAFDGQESEAFAVLRLSRPERISDAAGWPALAELLALADSGDEIAEAFLWEELLARLPVPRQRALATLAAIGRADDQRLSAATAGRTDARSVIENLPMTASTRDGWVSLHDLWQPALRRLLTPSERQAAQRRAGADAVARNDFASAFGLYAQAAAWNDVRDVIRLACLHSHPLVAHATMQDWHRALVRADRSNDAEAQLLMGVILRQNDPAAAASHLANAALSFQADGASDSEACCLFQLGQIYWWHGNAEELARLVDRLVRLAQGGSWLAASVLALAPLLGEPSSAPPAEANEVPAVAARMHPEVVPLREWIMARNHLFAGHADAALMAAQAGAGVATPSMQAISDFLVLQCQWAMGRREVVLEALEATIQAVPNAGLHYFTAADFAMGSMWLILAGQDGQAARYLERARAVPQDTSAWAGVVVELAGAMAEVHAGREVAAADRLLGVLGRVPLADSSAELAHRPWLALSYVLVPSTRPHWDTAELGPGYAQARSCAQALVAWRESGRVEVVGTPATGEIDLLANAIPVPWLAEWAAIAGADGQALDAVSWLASVGGAGRQRLGALATGRTSKVQRSAADLLRRAGRRPSVTVEIGVLGPLKMAFDREEQWPPGLNRRPVRDLLMVLIEHQTLTRGQIMGLLWPDFEEEAARANLRTTLSYLNKVLEPDRSSAESPCHISDRGEQLRLEVGEHLRLDSLRFDQLVAEAHRLEAAGVLSGAIDRYVEAVGLYRGEYLADAGLAEWALSPRDRYRLRFCAAAVRAGELLVARGDPARAADLAARAVAAEPWSEPARRVLVEAHIAAGDSAAAARALVACLAVVDELGVPPSAETTMLARRLGG